jgi:prepilin-type N-terminal cleavage/methylation domain-containing protein
LDSTKNGFTLIEILIAVSVFSVAIMAFLVTINSSLESVIKNKKRYEALYYSKELYEGIGAGVYDVDYSEDQNVGIEFPKVSGSQNKNYYREATISTQGILEVRCYGKNGELLVEIPRK